MNEDWTFGPTTVSAVASAVGAVGFLVTAFGIWLSYRQNRRARNLQAFISISEDFRRRWESGWRQVLQEDVPGLDLKKRFAGDVGKEMINMLNWLDWMGLILRLKLIDSQLVYGSIGPTIDRLLVESSHKILEDTEDPQRGPAWWSNVLFVARQRRKTVNLERSAAALQKKWAHSGP